MSLGKSIARFFKSIIAIFTGTVDEASDSLSKNPKAIRARYDGVIGDKVKSIQRYKEAIAGLIAQEERKLRELETVSKEIDKLENLKMGAAAKAKEVVATLKGKGQGTAAIQEDEEYRTCLAAFNDFSTNLAEKQERVEELEGSTKEYDKSINDHKIQLQGMLREMDDLKSEQAEAVADVITANEEKEIADILSGVAVGGKSEELQRLREMRNKAKAEARVSRELAGTDTQAAEAEFLAYARTSESSSEFDALIGLDAAEAPSADASVAEVPEADGETETPTREPGLPE